MDPRIEALIALMKADLRRLLPIGRMAQSVNLSPTRLSCLFKAETGSPPARYLRQMRMQVAATLLVETFLSVKEIMARVGINDESHFVRDFKRINGMTPMQYRRQHRTRDKKAVAGKD
jgi:AraC family transcriptional regulator of arabinose operon